MRVVLVGSGGREAALAWRIMQSPSLRRLVVTGDNPGWPSGAVLRAASGTAALVELARDEGADLVVCGPEQPLAEGLADALAEVGIPCFGPRLAAARLESSKAFAKEVMVAAGVPTAGSMVVDLDRPEDRVAAEARARRGDVVVKADGLAAGKGVVVCVGAEEALAALDEVRALGEAGRIVLLEDRLVGPEVSLFALCDGERAVALPSAQDHKQLLDGGRGPNTGGMGAVVPCPLVDAAAGEALVASVHQPVLDELRRRGIPFRGLLYAGLMMTPDGPRVLEFNVRFGDPECQPMMALWDDDILPWLLGAARGELPAGAPRFAEGAACCVVLASAGYPASKTVGVAIPDPGGVDGVLVFHAATRRTAEGLSTHGGRVLGLCGVGPDHGQARARAYGAVKGWSFEGVQLRTDIGASWS